MIPESLTIVQAQLSLGDNLSECGFSTLQTDGTTKFGEYYATYDVRVPKSDIHCQTCHRILHTLLAFVMSSQGRHATL